MSGALHAARIARHGLLMAESDRAVLREMNRTREELVEFRELISGCWDDDTKYPWSSPNSFKTKSRGQCWSTAMVAWIVFGGRIIMGRVDGEIHYWNELPDYGEIDFTSDQYGGNGTTPVSFKEKYATSRRLDHPRVVRLFHAYLKARSSQDD